MFDYNRPSLYLFYIENSPRTKMLLTEIKISYCVHNTNCVSNNIFKQWKTNIWKKKTFYRVKKTVWTASSGIRSNANWKEWRQWSTCSVSCGEGRNKITHVYKVFRGRLWLCCQSDMQWKKLLWWVMCLKGRTYIESCDKISLITNVLCTDKY